MFFYISATPNARDSFPFEMGWSFLSFSNMAKSHMSFSILTATHYALPFECTDIE